MKYLAERPSAADQTLIATIVSVGGQTTVMKGVDMAMSRAGMNDERAANAERHAALLKQITDISRASKVLESSPETFEQFLETAMEDGPVNAVYINGNTLLQSGMADQVAELIPELADQVTVVTRSGGMLQIPVSKYMTKISQTEAGNALFDHIKFDPNDYTKAEARDYMVNQAEILQKEIDTAIAQDEGVQEFRASQDRVKQAVLDSLNTLGRHTPQVNELYATLQAARAATRAAQLGITPEQMFERQLVKFASEQGKGRFVLAQALKSQPPKGWIHSDSGQDAVALWNQQTDAQAIFWTDLDGKLAQDAPDLAGYSLSLDKSRVNHIRARHGDEIRDGQVSVTEADVARIPEIVQGYDAAITNAMIPAEVGAQAQRGVVFAKEFEDGTIVYTGLVSRGRQNIRTATVWKYPPSIDAQTAVTRAAANLTSETYEGITSSVDPFDDEYNQPAFEGTEASTTPLQGQTEIEVDGVMRSALNSEGKPIHWSVEGVRNFWRWFGDSKAVDAQGRPLVVKHGSRSSFNEFRAPIGGVYFTTDGAAVSAIFSEDGRVDASEYYISTKKVFDARWPNMGDAQKTELREIINSVVDSSDVESAAAKLDVSIEDADPFDVFTDGEFFWGYGRGLQNSVMEAIKSRGYDGVIFPDDLALGESHTSYVAFTPTQIKSATGNSGAFDPANPNILYQAEQSVGPFGPIFTEYRGDAQGAIARLMQEQTGEAAGALSHPEIGEIDLVWGKEGTGASDGYGLSKLVKFHPEVLGDLQGIISPMRVVSRSANRVNLESADHRASVRLTWDGQEKHWLMTAFEKQEKGSVAGTRTDTAGFDGAGDTARRADASDSIVDQDIKRFYQSEQRDLDGLRQQWREMGVDATISERDGLITLSKIVIPEASRGQGQGTAAMQALVDCADQTGQHIALTPSSDFGGSKSRLVSFYKRFGFVENKGRNKAFSTSEAMYRLAPGRLLYQSGQRQATNFTQAREAAKAFQGKDLVNEKTGIVAVVSRNSLDKMLSNKAVGKSETPALHSLVVANLDSLFQSAILGWSKPDRAGDQNIGAIHRFFTSIQTAWGPRIVKMTVKETAIESLNNPLYTVEAVELNEETPAVSWVDAAAKDDGLDLISIRPAGAVYSLAESIQQGNSQLNQGSKSPRGSYSPDQNIITLLKGSDLSTFLHESGHYFFESDIELAGDIVKEAKAFGYDGLKEGEKQILDDVSSLLRWHGIQGNIEEQLATWANLGFEENRVYHERTAESFEKYLIEGKTPSIELQSYFQTFRSWLLNVYKSIKDFLARNPEAGQLNDEVRAVFDRMLATNAQIEMAQIARSMMPMIKTAEDAQRLGLTADWYEAYQKMTLDVDLDSRRIGVVTGSTVRKPQIRAVGKTCAAHCNSVAFMRPPAVSCS